MGEEEDDGVDRVGLCRVGLCRVGRRIIYLTQLRCVCMDRIRWQYVAGLVAIVSFTARAGSRVCLVRHRERTFVPTADTEEVGTHSNSDGLCRVGRRVGSRNV